jgi:hypothetical protein
MNQLHSPLSLDIFALNQEQEKQFFPLTVNLWLQFCLIVLAYIGLIILRNSLILTPDIYYRGLADQMTEERIDSYLSMKSQYWWVVAISPLINTLCKTLYTALCLAIGTIILGIDIQFTKLFRIALLAESVFVAAMALQVFGAMYLIEVRVPDDYANFAPLSALQFFDPATLKLWMKHPLRTVNLFEVAYMLVLAYFLTPLLKKRTYLQTLGLVVSSYGLGLLLWVVALAFLLLQVS